MIGPGSVAFVVRGFAFEEGGPTVAVPVPPRRVVVRVVAGEDAVVRYDGERGGVVKLSQLAEEVPAGHAPISGRYFLGPGLRVEDEEGILAKARSFGWKGGEEVKDT